MGWLETIIGGALTKALSNLTDKLIAWFKELFRKEQIVKRGEKYAEETEARVQELERLHDQAKREVDEYGSVTEETREAIRKAGRNLVRGPRS